MSVLAEQIPEDWYARCGVVGTDPSSDLIAIGYPESDEENGHENLDGIEFSRRLYFLDELRDIYASVGMESVRVYNGAGCPKQPKANQFEIFVGARNPEQPFTQ